MNIAFLSVFNYGSNIGGVENHIYFMSNELKKMGNDIIIFQPIEECKANKEKINIDNITIIYIPIKSLKIFNFLSRFNGNKFFGFLTAFLNKAKFILSYRKIAKEILKYDIDIIHQHDFISNIFTTKYLHKKNKKIILTNHTGEYLFFKKNIYGRFLLKYLLRHYDAIIGPSLELTPFNFHGNVYTIHNGVNNSIFYEFNKTKKSQLRTKYNYKEEEILIFCPRRWAPTKGVIYLIESIINNEYPSNYKFLFAGSDYEGYSAYRNKINKILYEHNISKNQVVKLGNLNINDMCIYYNISDIVVIPSLMEAVSLSAIEAMATGTPVISTNVGGMPELIENNKNGLLIQPKSEKEIYDAIMKLKDKTLYNKIKSESIKTANKFSWESIAKQTFSLYLQIRKTK